eukprot:Opistho-2@86188
MDTLYTPSLMIASNNLLMAELMQKMSNDVMIKVTSIITDGSKLLGKIAENSPNYVLIDSELNDYKGIEIFKKIEQIPTTTRVIIYSFSQEANFLKYFLSSNAIAYIQNGCSLSEFQTCLKNILDGKRVILSNVDSNMKERTNHREVPQYDFSLLTEREKAIWNLIIQEMTEREIANKLIISINTVRTHKSNISKKIGIKSKKRLTRIAASSINTYIK